MNRDFEFRREVSLPASPDQVWDAVATGAGNAAWLWEMAVEERQGGAIDGQGAVTVWDPPRRFVGRTDLGEGRYSETST